MKKKFAKLVCFLTSWSSSSALLGGTPARRRIGRRRHTLSIIWCQSLTRGQKVQSRREREILYSFLQFWEEKEKPEIHFPSFERRKRNLKKGSPLSRRERERDFLFSSFERRKRIFFKISNFEKRKRNLKFFSPVLRREREIWKRVLHFREEKEKWIFFSQISRGEREFWKRIL